MRANTEKKLPHQGLTDIYFDRDPKAVFRTGIICQYLAGVFRIYDVDPWGLILPLIDNMDGLVFYNFEAETFPMPKGTIMGVRWTPHSGKNIHTLTHTLPGDGHMSTIIRIPFDWLFECEGESVLIEYEVSYPDGSTQLGQSFDVRVAKRMEYGAVTIADLKHGDKFNPDKYPDGIPVTIDPIVNVEEYNTIRFFWKASGYLPDSMIIITSWMKVINCAPGKTYEFVVPPEAYSGLDISGFDRIELLVTPGLVMLPEPLLQMGWGFGSHSFDVSFDAK